MEMLPLYRPMTFPVAVSHRMAPMPSGFFCGSWNVANALWRGSNKSLGGTDGELGGRVSGRHQPLWPREVPELDDMTTGASCGLGGPARLLESGNE